MHQYKLKRITLGIFLAFLPFATYAAGLGKLNVMSGLGEPLSAEIEVLSATPDELSELSATIAPEEAYAVQGLERPGFHNQIKVLLAKKANGTPVLKLSTTAPVTDPFLDMLVQVDWPTGRLIREFTMLLDPPDYANNVNSPSVSSTITKSATVKPSTAASEQAAGSSNQRVSPQAANRGGNKRKNVTGSNVKSGKAKRGNQGMAQADLPAAEAYPQADSANNEAGPAGDIAGLKTEKGDTLSSIARQNQVDGLSLDQMLIGIYRANKTAFVADNINRLKVGQIIRVPNTEELQSVSPNEARREVRLHTNDWQQYRNKLAGNVADTPAARDDAAEGKQSASGKIAASAEDKAIPQATGPRDVIKLSKNDTANAKQPDAKGLQDKLTALQEEAIAREKSVKEASERTAILEKQIQDMQKLLTMKSQAMADMQKNSATTATPVAPAPVVPTEIPKPSAADAEKPADAVPAQQPETPPAPAAAAETPAPENPAAEPTKEKAIAKPVVKAPIAPVVATEPSFIDTLLEDPLPLGLAGLLAILVGAWLLLRNKRKRGLDGFEKSILTSGGLKANTVFGNTLGDSVNTGDTSFLTDFSQSSSGMIDTNDVDPIAEAEVYMAYGRDKQAEEILRDAITKEPSRYELHLKLLEVYVGNNDVSAFEATAGELYTTLGAEDPVWAKVAELGRQIDPGNPLYQAANALPTAAGASNNSTASNDAALALNVGAAAIAAGVIAEKSGLDFSFDDRAEEGIGNTQDSNGQNFEVVDSPAETYPMENAGSSSISDDDANSLDFGLMDVKSEPDTLFEETISFNADDLAAGNPSFTDSVAQTDKEAALDFPFEMGQEAANPEASALDFLNDPELNDPGLNDPELNEIGSSSFEPTNLMGNHLGDNDLGFDVDVPELATDGLSQDSESPFAATTNLPSMDIGSSDNKPVGFESSSGLATETAADDTPASEALLDIELPQASSTAGVSAPESTLGSELPAMEFDIPHSLDLDELEAASKLGSNVDFSDTLQLPALDPAASTPSQPDFSAASGAAIDSSPEKLQAGTAQSGEVDEDIVFEAIAPEDDAIDLDFNLDLDSLDPENADRDRFASDDAATAASTGSVEAPAIDLSGISFDLDDGQVGEESGIEFPDSGLAEEPSEVETKLDLVTAYIDMGDNEGARELLEEILQEGGPDQRVRAQDILNGLS